MQEIVRIFDTTLRDGEQSPGFSMNVAEKIRVAKQLERLNVDIIEAGFPISSDGDFEAVKEISKGIKNTQIAGLARTEIKDIDRAWEALKYASNPLIHIVIATSDIHLHHKLKKSKDEVLENAVQAVKHAKGYTPNVEFSAEDATRSDVDYLCKIFERVIDAGATIINIPDTVGYAMPDELGFLIKHIKETVPNIDEAIISVHCHNDLGLAVANTLAAIKNGARQVECTINGIGERAGNASLEEIVMALRTRSDFHRCDTHIHPEHIYNTSRLLSHITGVAVQPNKAIVGSNAFAHESGIHQDGVLKEKTTYEIMTPESIGVSKTSLVLGKHSGRHAFRDRLREIGYELSEENLNLAFKRFKELSDKKKTVFDEDIEAIIIDEILRIPDTYKLIYLNVISGSVTVPVATVQIEMGGEIIQEAGFGVGPVDAVFKAISNITKTNSKLIRFSVNSFTGGTDALGEVTVRLEENGIQVIGQGADTDIIMSSAKAFVNALNRLEYRRKHPITI
ncbi:MAG: 2-isopropylmalate synthase [Thermodesulfobacteriota bacterium]|nr:2-isopropylmalate synthase [Thermodesulfobacteriota bacterium]